MYNRSQAQTERRRIEGLVEAIAGLRDPEDLVRSAFLRRVADRGLGCFHRVSVDIEELSADRLRENAAVVLSTTSGEHGRVEHALIEVDGVALGLVRPGHGRNTATITLAGEEGTALVEVAARLREALADAPRGEERVRVWFWAGGSGSLAGAHGSPRRLEMPVLASVRENYAPPAADACCAWETCALQTSRRAD